MKFSIAYPVSPEQVIQGFGVNKAYYQANVDPRLQGHPGIDFKAFHGQPVYATHDGVAFFEIDDKQGHGVVIRTNQVFDYVLDPQYSQVYFKSIYWHFCDGVKEPQFNSPITFTDMYGAGQPVKRGDLIGYADSTGTSEVDHLHFSVKPQLPSEPNGTWSNVEQTNGFLGNIDPTPYFDGTFANIPIEDPVVVANLTKQITLLQKVVNLLKILLKIK